MKYTKRVILTILAAWLAAPGLASAQEIKLKLSHFTPAAHNHMPRIFRGIMPFLAAMVVLLMALTAWPDLALILPRSMK